MAKTKKTAHDANGQRMQGNVERELPVKLTEQEISEYGKQQAALELQRDRLLDEKSAFNSAQGQKIKEVAERITKLATAVDKGEETRLIPCRWEESFEQKCRWLVVVETGAEVPDTRRPMTSDELQQSLVS